MNDTYLALLLNELMPRGRKTWLDKVVNAIGFILVFGFLIIMTAGHILYG